MQRQQQPLYQVLSTEQYREALAACRSFGDEVDPDIVNEVLMALANLYCSQGQDVEALSYLQQGTFSTICWFARHRIDLTDNPSVHSDCNRNDGVASTSIDEKRIGTLSTRRLYGSAPRYANVLHTIRRQQLCSLPYASNLSLRARKQ